MFPLNVPNVLTLVRILLVPVLVVALLDETPNGDLLAAIVFVVASLTDLLDGYLARTRGAITTFGKLMDPIADKLLIVAALVALVSLDRLAAWVAMVIIAREFAVTAMRMGRVNHRDTLSAAEADRAFEVGQHRTPGRCLHRRTRRDEVILHIYHDQRGLHRVDAFNFIWHRIFSLFSRDRAFVRILHAT